MHRLFIALVMTICFFANAFAEEFSSAYPSNCERGFCTGITCEKGKCEGWEGSYEYIPATGYADGTQLANFFFRNRTGKTAFNIKITINFWNTLGDYMGRLVYKEEGPISQWIPYSRVKVPFNTSKITYDIYWSDEYVPQGQIGG